MQKGVSWGGLRGSGKLGRHRGRRRWMGSCREGLGREGIGGDQEGMFREAFGHKAVLLIFFIPLAQSLKKKHIQPGIVHCLWTLA